MLPARGEHRSNQRKLARLGIVNLSFAAAILNAQSASTPGEQHPAIQKHRRRVAPLNEFRLQLLSGAAGDKQHKKR
jgi:hypothetical protein